MPVKLWTERIGIASVLDWCTYAFRNIVQSRKVRRVRRELAERDEWDLIASRARFKYRRDTDACEGPREEVTSMTTAIPAFDPTAAAVGLTVADEIYLSDLDRRVRELNQSEAAEGTVSTEPSKMRLVDQPRTGLVDIGKTREGIDIEKVESILSKAGFQRK